MLPETLDCPPFPPLRWEYYSWVGELGLPWWKKYHLDEMGEAAPARLTVSCRDDAVRSGPSPEQVRAFQHLLDNEAAIANAVALALVDYCPGEAYDGDEFMDVSEPDDLLRMVELLSVHVLDIDEDGMACIGFEFQCLWDGEHGAGVMTHRGRVLATEQADCSFTTWIARHGLERQRERGS